MSPRILYLTRHAKSSWDDPGLPDHERPLNKRGERDAPRMGKRIAKRKDQPELIVSSPAVRAATTVKVIAKELGFKPSDVVIEERIYGADQQDMIEIIQQLDDNFRRVMLIGHNPTLTDLLNELADCEIDNLPTCGIAVLGFDLKKWKDLRVGRAHLLDFDYPKKTKE